MTSLLRGKYKFHYLRGRIFPLGLVLINLLIFTFILRVLYSKKANKTTTPTETSAAINGPLRVSSQNPRYFTDNSGNAIYLTGSHTWNNLVDIISSASPSPFN